ncbi:MAG: hypothetical protein ACYDAC_01570 [Candidatus Dormibacteria bacterium]
MQFTVIGGATFTGHGVTFRPGSGWDIDASANGAQGRTIQLKGHLPC